MKASKDKGMAKPQAKFACGFVIGAFKAWK